MIKNIMSVKIDLNDLNDMIATYYGLEDKSPYIFANDWTLQQIAKQCNVEYESKDKTTPGIIALYHGCPVFEHFGLKDGQVEVR